MQKRIAMKKFWFFILVLVALAIVMKLTVPSVEKHYDVATDRLAALLVDKVMEDDEYDDVIAEYGIDKDAAVQVLQQDDLYKTLIRYNVESLIDIKDYVVCNVGKVTYEDKVYPLTVGLFGSVFVLTDYLDEIQKVSAKMEQIKEKLD